MAFLVIGSYGLSNFTQLRYTYQKSKKLSKEDEDKLDLRRSVKPQKSLEEEYVSMNEQVLKHQWDNVRGPRPWEEGNESAKPKL